MTCNRKDIKSDSHVEGREKQAFTEAVAKAYEGSGRTIEEIIKDANRENGAPEQLGMTVEEIIKRVNSGESIWSPSELEP